MSSAVPVPTGSESSSQVFAAIDDTSPTTGSHDAFARIAGRLGAQRVEIFLTCADETVLVGQWAALGQPAHPYANGNQLKPTGWFPWSLGNIRPAEYLFVRNAGPLPLTPTDSSDDAVDDCDPSPRLTIGDLGLSSALYIPVLVPANQVGALCVYWSAEQSSWPFDSGPTLSDWASDVLAKLR